MKKEDCFRTLLFNLQNRPIFDSGPKNCNERSMSFTGVLVEEIPKVIKRNVGEDNSGMPAFAGREREEEESFFSSR